MARSSASRSRGHALRGPLTGHTALAAHGQRAPVLALIGDRYHNADYIRLHLKRLFYGAGIEFEYTVNYEWFTSGAAASLLDERSLLCIFRDGLVFPDGYIGPEAYSHYILNLMGDPPKSEAQSWVTKDVGRAVEEFVANGGSLLCCHNALSISCFSEEFRRVVAGAYDGHPPERNWRVLPAQPDHPLLSGVNEFVVTDEQHFPLYDGPDGNILLRGVNTDGLQFTSDSGLQRSCESVVAWSHEYRRGRVVVCTIGHNLDALWKPDSFQFQRNALRWLLET